MDTEETKNSDKGSIEMCGRVLSSGDELIVWSMTIDEMNNSD
jgi:hypothetical protein